MKHLIFRLNATGQFLLFFVFLWTTGNLVAAEIHDAVQKGDFDKVTALLAGDPKLVKATNNLGMTPLHVAASTGQYKMAELLLSQGADANVKNRLGFKPVDLVVGRQNDQLAALLEQHMTRGVKGGEPASVGVLGDFTRIQFQGNQAFSASALKKGLIQNPDVVMASHPSARRDAFLEVLQEKLVLGYQNAGYPRVQVSASYVDESQKVAVQIAEKECYRMGEIILEGVITVPTNILIKRMTEPWPPPGSQLYDRTGKSISRKGPLWQTGEPAPFDTPTRKSMEEWIAWELSEWGCFFPEVKVQVVPDDKAHVAALRVNIVKEGPVGVIGKIRFVGNTKNSEADLLKFLELRSGIKCDRDLVTRCEQRLWKSGRFMDFEVKPQVSEKDKSSQIDMEITLREYSKGAPLMKKLSNEEQVLSKAGDWLSSPKTEDMVVKSDGTDMEGLKDLQLEMVFSPNNGLWFEMRKDKAPGTEPYAFIASKEGLAFYGPGNRKWQTTVTNLLIDGFIHLVPDVANTKEEMASFSVGGGVKQSTDSWEINTNAPFQIDLLVAPMVLIRESQREGAKMTLAGGQLTIMNSNAFIRLDAATGRLKSFVQDSDSIKATMGFAADAFQDRVAGIRKRNATNLYDPERPVSSFSAFVIKDFLQSDYMKDISSNSMAAVLGDFLVQTASGSLDRYYKEVETEGQSFYLPMEKNKDQNGMKALLCMVSGVIFRFANEWFPERSWPWTVTHEAVFVLGGNTQYTDKELQRLYNAPDTGPVGFLIMGKLVEKLNPQIAKTLAARGMERLNASDFRHDWMLFVEGTPAAREMANKVAARLRSMTDAEADALVDKSGAGPFIRTAARKLKESPNGKLADVLAPVFDDYWNQQLKQAVQEELAKVGAAAKKRER